MSGRKYITQVSLLLTYGPSEKKGFAGPGAASEENVAATGDSLQHLALWRRQLGKTLIDTDGPSDLCDTNLSTTNKDIHNKLKVNFESFIEEDD